MTERRRRVALVLGSGGARGLAHMGVIEAIEARGLEIVSVAGSSMGAVIGGIHAAGRLPAYRDWVTTLARGQVLRLVDFVWGSPGLVRGQRVVEAMTGLIGEHRIEELPLPFVAVACDLATQRQVWLTRGPLMDAIRASFAIPGVFTPHLVDGRELVDGGLLAPVPIAAARMVMADLVVAVDVNGRPEPAAVLAVPSPEPVIEGSSDAAQRSAPGEPPPGYAARLADLFEGMLQKKPQEARPQAVAQPGVLDLMSRSLDTMQGALARLQLAMDPPDVLVRVPRDACAFYEFWRAAELVALGRETADRALDAAGL